MTIRRITTVLIVLLVPVTVVLVASRLRAQEGVEKRFSQLDANRDDKLSPAELPQAAMFRLFDLNGDGEITKPEATEAFRKGVLKAATVNSSHDVPVTSIESSKPFSAPVRQGPELLVPGEHGIGDYVADFEFTDVSEKHHRLTDFKAHKTVVFAMTSTSCPISRKYLPTLVELAKTYAGRGVPLVQQVLAPAVHSSAGSMLTKTARSLAKKFASDCRTIRTPPDRYSIVSTATVMKSSTRKSSTACRSCSTASKLSKKRFWVGWPGLD